MVGEKSDLNHVVLAALGLVTIVAYGSWFYSFGVLLDPIRLETGWSETMVTTSFAVGSIVVGVGAIVGGRVLDRIGSRAVLLIGGTGGALGLVATSYAQSAAAFFVASATAMGFLGAFGFYHATMTTAARTNPANAARAIAVLTIWGAFASVVYLPLSAALVERFDWRVTTRILATIVVVVFGVAAAVVSDAPDDTKDRGLSKPAPLRHILASTVATPARRAYSTAVAFGGVALSTVLVYQVPTMTDAGLPLTTAATLAGVRGFAQTAGRIPISPIVARLGSSRALVLSFSAIAVGGALLAASSTIAIGLSFALITGFGIGAFSPLQGMKAEELFERETLGTTMGSYSAVLMVAGAAGPAIAGVLSDVSGDRRVASLVIVTAAVGAIVSALRLYRAEHSAAASR